MNDAIGPHITTVTYRVETVKSNLLVNRSLMEDARGSWRDMVKYHVARSMEDAHGRIIIHYLELSDPHPFKYTPGDLPPDTLIVYATARITRIPKNY